MTDWEERYKAEKLLNAGLVRIMTERANAKRGMQPKKERFGYQLIVSAQADWKYKDDERPDAWGRPTLQTAQIWRTSLSSPYPAQLPLEAVESRLEDDLGLLEAKLGLEGGRAPDFEDAKPGSYFKVLLNRDFKIGLWVLNLYHISPIEPDEDLLPATDDSK